MPQGDVAVRTWIRDKKRFADLFNGTVFLGKQVVFPEELTIADSESDILLADKDGKVKTVQRYRDVIMTWRGQTKLLVLACENQSFVHYGMPIRMMLYDSLSYAEQMRKLWESRKPAGNTDAGERKVTEREEYMSKFRKTDRLCPVISLVLYYDLKRWDASIDLYGMFPEEIQKEYGEVLQKYISNYRINLIDLGKVQHLERFHSDLQYIFGMLQYRDNKRRLQQYVWEHKDYFSHLDLDTFLAVQEFTHSKTLFQKVIPEGEGKEQSIDMCKALEDIYKDGMEAGIEAGIEAGMEAGREEGMELGIERGRIQEIIECFQEFQKTKEEVLDRVMMKFSLSRGKAEEYVNLYWK